MTHDFDVKSRIAVSRSVGYHGGVSCREPLVIYRVHAIPQSIVDQVRSTMKSPGFGHPAHLEVANGTGPCRSCLRPFQVGQDQRILFTYQPFDQAALPSPGPVFIHAGHCERFAGPGIPRELHPIPMVVEAFREDGRPFDRVPLGAGSAEETIIQQLFDDGASFLHLRHAQAGCFIARVVSHEAGNGRRET